MGAQFAPSASQRFHTYVNASGERPAQVPVVEVSIWPGCARPMIVGGAMITGAATLRRRSGETSGALKRSPSAQCLIPGTWAQSVHCHNVQPPPAQFAAGTPGLDERVQRDSQRGGLMVTIRGVS